MTNEKPISSEPTKNIYLDKSVKGIKELKPSTKPSTPTNQRKQNA